MKERQISPFLRQPLFRIALLALIYALITAVVGMLIVNLLCDIKTSLVYGFILTGCLFLIAFLFLLIKSKSKRQVKE